MTIPYGCTGLASRVTYPWDYGVTSIARRTVAPADYPLSIAYLRDQHLRVTNGSAEDEFIELALQSAVDACEQHIFVAPRPQRVLMPQTWELRLSGFPVSGRIVLPRAPVIGVTSLAYYDDDDAPQTLSGSPAEYEFVPSGDYTPAEVRVLSGTSWPSVSSRLDAVVITFEAGYALDETVSPHGVTVPARVLQGLALMVGELYKQRTISQIGTSIVEAPISVQRLWDGPY